jgi:hypothetical protein
MTVAEFRATGLLQEINRRLLHPCGLALEVIVAEDGTESFGAVWDYREDPEGITFGPGMINRDAIALVDALITEHAEARTALLGSIIQEPDSL